MLNIMLINLRNMPLLTGFDCLIKVYFLKLTGFLALLGIVTVLLEYNDHLYNFPKNLSYYASHMLDAFGYLLCF